MHLHHSAVEDVLYHAVSSSQRPAVLGFRIIQGLSRVRERHAVPF